MIDRLICTFNEVERVFICPKEKNPSWRAFYGLGYGTNTNEHLVLDPIEALSLLESNKVLLTKGTNLMNSPELLQILGDEIIQYVAYKSLKQKGFILRIKRSRNLVFFEIYPKRSEFMLGKSMGFLYITTSAKPIDLNILKYLLDKATIENKKFLIGVIDEAGDISIYEVSSVLSKETKLKIK